MALRHNKIIALLDHKKAGETFGKRQFNGHTEGWSLSLTLPLMPLIVHVIGKLQKS